jgi:hypothetical protein
MLSARAIEDLKAMFAKLCGDLGAELKAVQRRGRSRVRVLS